MEGATLNIKFTDETVGGKGPATTPIAGSPDQGDPNVAATQQAITQGGGVGSYTASKNPPPSPLAPLPTATTYQVPEQQVVTVPSVGTTTASSDPLLNTVSGIVKADPNVTVEELAKALGLKLSQAQNLYNQAIGVGTPPSTQPVPASPVPPPGSVPPLPPSPIQPPPVPPPVAAVTPPLPPPTAPPIHGQPTPPPVVQPATPPTPTDAAQGVQNTIQAISELARQGGPLAGAVASLGQATMDIPGVASGIGTALPAAAAAAPYVALATAAIAVPTAVAYSIDRIYDTARGQLQGLDPNVARAEAEANIRQIMANFRTSRVLGDEVAEGIEIQSRRSAVLQGLRDTFSEIPLQRMNNAAKGFNALLETLDKFADSKFGKAATQGTADALYNQMLASLGATGLAIKLLEFVGVSGSKDKALNFHNPFSEWSNKPLPPLPEPFTEAGSRITPRQIESNLPGLGL